MKDEFVACVGVWGCGCPVDTSAEGRSTDRADRRDRRHYNYLKKHSPTVINVMRLKGTLEQYLTDFDHDTQETYDLLIRQYAEIERRHRGPQTKRSNGIYPPHELHPQPRRRVRSQRFCVCIIILYFSSISDAIFV